MRNFVVTHCTIISTLCLGVVSFVPRAPFYLSSPTTIDNKNVLNAIKRRGRPKGPFQTVEVKPPMNQEIKYSTVRVTTPNPKGGKDEILGIMSKAEALAKATELGDLDLILINENSDPPVCKIVDYSKYRYMKEKKAKEQKKNAKASEVKEVKMTYKIDSHDYDVRKRNAQKFLMQGNRVKCTITFKGREAQYDNLGVELLERLAEDLEKFCNMEGKPKREGRNLSSFLTPKPEVLKAINDKKRAEERALRKKKEASLKALEEKQASDDGTEGEEGVEQIDEESETISIADLLSAVDEDDDEADELDDLLGTDKLTDDLFA